MVRNAAEGKEDIRSINAGNGNKLVYLTSRITALSSTKLHYNFHCFLLTDKTHALIQEHPEFSETSPKALLQGF